MRYSGLAHPQEQIPVLPDTALALLLTAATAQAWDYPTGTDIIRITAASTLAVPLVFNPSSTFAAVLTTGGSISSSVGGQNIVISPGDSRMYQRPRGSTGFSLISASSVQVGVEFWSRAGTTG